MNWIFLIVGGLFEAGFTFCMGIMKGATGWSWWAWLLGFIACTFVSMGLLVKASQTLLIGTCYPVWTGVGQSARCLSASSSFMSQARSGACSCVPSVASDLRSSASSLR